MRLGNEGAKMKRTFALLTGAAVALGWLAIAPDANAHERYFGQYGYYYGDPSFGYYDGPSSFGYYDGPSFGYYDGPPLRYYGGPSFGRSPMYAPDSPAPRRYNNPGRRDFQDGSRG
jgi:hypothetical protein